MAISTAQYIDLLFKKLQGVAKTATATQKSASNESIASPALLRGDIVWTQSDQIPGTAQVVSGVTQGYLTTSRIECTADITVPTIGGIYPTWLTNLQYWIPQEFGSTWPVKVWVDNTGAADPTSTGTQIFAPGIGGVGEFFFDTQAGVLNFIGETIPSTLTAGKSIFITGYRYVGQLGVTNLPSANIGNIQITGNTIATLNTNGDLVFDPNGSGNVQILANTSITGNITASGFVSATGNITGNYFIGNGSQLTGVAASSVNANALIGDTLSSNVLYSSLTQVGTLSNVSVSGNVVGGNVLTGGTISATATITGGNLLTGGLISATSTITSAANITGGNLLTAGSVSATADITGGNLLSGGLASVTGNVTGGNLLTGGITSATGNITGGNVLTGGLVSAAGTVTGSSLLGSIASLSGNITGGNVLTGGSISATSTITSAANITGGNVLTGGLISATGNIISQAGSFFIGNGSQLTGVTAASVDANALTGNTLSANVINSSLTSVGNLTLLNVVGNTTSGNVLTGGLISSTGTITSAANINANNVIATTIVNAPSLTGTIASLSGNVTGGNLVTGGAVTATGNITGGNIITSGSGGNITGANVISGTTLTATSNIIGGNVLTGGVISATSTVTGSSLLGTVASLSGNVTGGNVVTGGLISATGNITGGNIVTVGKISTSGNVYGNAILSDNYFYANGTPIPTGIVYTAAISPPAGPDVGDQWYDTTSDVLYEYINDGTSNYWVDTTSPAFAGGVVANVAISGTLVPIANVTYDIGTNSVYFRNTYTQNLYTNNRLPAYNMPLGAVVQTVMSSSLGGSITNSTSYADVTYATVTITPSSATSKVLILATGTSGFTALSGQDVSAETQLVRSPSTSLQIQTVGTSVAGGGVGATGAVSYSYMDAPGTTSAVTYKLQQKVSNASSTLTSTNIWLIALEIAAS
jgi:hypothetical protein